MSNLFRLLFEGRHDDIIEQAHKSAEKKLGDEDGSEIINHSRNQWRETKINDDFRSLPNKWKVFFAELHKSRLSHIIANRFNGVKLNSKFPINDRTVVQPLHNDIMLRQVSSLLGSYPDANLHTYDPTTAKTPEEAVKELLSMVEDYEKRITELTEPDGSEKLLFDLGKFKWFDLQKNYCEDEGEAMGHCGNSHSTGSHETIISLRRVMKVGNKEYHRPSLTFILDTISGYLTETRGRANTKPKKSYHPFIVELFRDNRIKGISLRYNDEKDNFVISDLNHEMLQRLYSIRPDLKEQFETMQLLDDKFHEVLQGNASRQTTQQVMNAIPKSGKYSLLYAKHIGKEYPEGEEEIAKLNTRQILDYARIIEGRFPKGEPRLLGDIETATMYHEEFVKEPWYELEKVFEKEFESGDPGDVYDHHVLAIRYTGNSGVRFLTLEKHLFNTKISKNAYIVLQYLRQLTDANAYQALVDNIENVTDFSHILSAAITSHRKGESFDFIKTYAAKNIESQEMKDALSQILVLLS